MSEITSNFNQQAREAEKAVLGGLMLETERFDSVILKISDKDFHGKDHQLIFESMGELINENKPLDPCLLYTSPSPRDRLKSRMPSSA